ncbi:MAG: DUF1801 domain-containing protein [Planctomycetota bacterium]
MKRNGRSGYWRPIRNVKIYNSFDELLAKYTIETQESCLALRRIVYEVSPRSSEKIDSSWRAAIYNYKYNNSGATCGIQPTAAGCNFYLMNAGALDDPDGWLRKIANQTRYIKIAERGEIPRDQIVKWLKTLTSNDRRRNR